MIKDYNWISLYGDFEINKNEIKYKNRLITDDKTKKQNNSLGLIVCNKGLIEGEIKASVTFKDTNLYDNTCLIVPYYDNETNEMLTIGISIGSPNPNNPIPAFILSLFGGPSNINNWKNLVITGDSSNIKPNKSYNVKTIIRGSRIELFIDDVGIFSYNVPNFNFSEKQSGFFCTTKNQIIINDFEISKKLPKAFTIMQFTSPFNELFDDVIVPVCNKKGVEARRADKIYSGANLIITDIINEIWLSNFIIADITSFNPNVFFEIGYTLALNKPIILISDKEKQKEIPFDVSGFRILYYSNTIPGKKLIEEDLRKHIDSILQLRELRE